MQSKQIEECKDQTKILFKVVDKLEQRISTLEKSLSALNKVIGELLQVEYERDINAK